MGNGTGGVICAPGAGWQLLLAGIIPGQGVCGRAYWAVGVCTPKTNKEPTTDDIY